MSVAIIVTRRRFLLTLHDPGLLGGWACQVRQSRPSFNTHIAPNVCVQSLLMGQSLTRMMSLSHLHSLPRFVLIIWKAAGNRRLDCSGHRSDIPSSKHRQDSCALSISLALPLAPPFVERFRISSETLLSTSLRAIRPRSRILQSRKRLRYSWNR